MCQDPCIIMCVRSARPFSKRMMRFFPRALTSSMRSPTGPGPSLVARNRFTRAPCSALRSAVAARKTVSPSGIFLLQRLRLLRWPRLPPERRALEVAADAGGKARRLELGRERRGVPLLPVDTGDQERLAAAGVDQAGQRLSQRACAAAPIRFIVGEEGVQILLPAPKPAEQRAVVEHHLRSGSALRPRLAVLPLARPGQRGAVRVRRIGRRQDQRERFSTRLAEAA